METLSWKSGETEGAVLTRAFVKFLGVHRGQIWEQTEIEDCEANPALRGTKISIASSMTIVIPDYEVTKLVQQADFVQQRDARDQRPDRKQLEENIRKAMRTQEGRNLLNSNPL
jgi:hypothetical protein